MAKTLLLAAALVCASAATASAKGKPPVTGATCKPSVAVVLTGKLASAGSSALPFALTVSATGGNQASSAWRKLTQPISVQVTSATAVSRQGDKKAADLKSGDRVTIQARACKADTASAPPPALTAARITAHPSH